MITPSVEERAVNLVFILVDEDSRKLHTSLVEAKESIVIEIHQSESAAWKAGFEKGMLYSKVAEKIRAIPTPDAPEE